MAKKYGIFEEVLENYNDYIFHECQKYLCNLGHKKVLESQMGIDLFSSSGYKEYIASVQNNQLVIVQYLYDDGKNYNALGDIDVLIIDREYHKIIAAEVKNFNFSKNPYEMHLEYKKMFENTKKKKGYYTKHCRRVDWCNKHIDDFKKQYGLDDGDWRVIGVFILSQSLVSTEIYHKEIKMLTEKELSVSSIRNIY